MMISETAFRIILRGLLKLKLIKTNEEDLFKNKIHYVFMPHSLGHYIG